MGINGSGFSIRSASVSFIPFFHYFQERGEGWYILTPSHEFVGPLSSQESAENVLFSALEELRGKAMTAEERQKAYEWWGEH